MCQFEIFKLRVSLFIAIAIHIQSLCLFISIGMLAIGLYGLFKGNSLNQTKVKVKNCTDISACQAQSESHWPPSWATSSAAPRPSYVWYRTQKRVVHRGIKNVGRKPNWCRPNLEHQKTHTPFFIPSQENTEHVNNVRRVVSPLWCGLSNIHGLILDGKYHQQGWAISQTPTVPAVCSVRITTAVLNTYNLTTVVCLRWKLVTNQCVVIRRSS